MNVKFTLKWDNSWRTSSGQKNWDAAWIFIKWREKGSTVWSHATLHTNGHVAATGSTIDTPSDLRGVFIYRSANGTGSNNWNVSLRWDYGVDLLVNSDKVEIRIYGIEMVYSPTSAFELGDESSSVAGNFESRTGGAPFTVSSENAITLGGGSSGSLGNHNRSGMYASAGFSADDFNDGSYQSLPTAFPKGFNDFYMMKYEISQQQYVEHLNTLTYTQQATHTCTPSSSVGTSAKSVGYGDIRNGIKIRIKGTYTSIPAVYGCDLNDDGNFDGTSDGQNVACGFLAWKDLAAYLDWAALRPMTELEYEKACRGTIAAVAGEYAWGTTTLSCSAGISNPGTPTEIPSSTTPNCVCNSSAGSYSIPAKTSGGPTGGPLRSGSFADATSTRSAAGASAIGVMDLSGNVWERAVTVGSSTGRAYTGVHGDGSLATDGTANVTKWPTSTATAPGTGFRGGSCNRSSLEQRVSDRVYANFDEVLGWQDYGGRGVRTAP